MSWVARSATTGPTSGSADAWIDLGPQQVHLIESTVPSNLGQHFAIRVADLDVVVGELRSKGLDVDDPVPVGSGRQTFVDRPVGEPHRAA